MQYNVKFRNHVKVNAVWESENTFKALISLSTISQFQLYILRNGYRYTLALNLLQTGFICAIFIRNVWNDGHFPTCHNMVICYSHCCQYSERKSELTHGLAHSTGSLEFVVMAVILRHCTGTLYLEAGINGCYFAEAKTLYIVLVYVCMNWEWFINEEQSFLHDMSQLGSQQPSGGWS